MTDESNQDDTLRFEEALAAYEAFDGASSTVKGRTWTVSAWILSVNSAILAYVFGLLGPGREAGSPKLFIGVAILSGLTLCLYLLVFIFDQARHLRRSWVQAERATDSNSALKNIVLGNPPGGRSEEPKNCETQAPRDDPKDYPFLLRWLPNLPKQREVFEETGKPFPGFCQRLLLLVLLYGAGFVVAFAFLLFEPGKPTG